MVIIIFVYCSLNVKFTCYSSLSSWDWRLKIGITVVLPSPKTGGSLPVLYYMIKNIIATNGAFSHVECSLLFRNLGSVIDFVRDNAYLLLSMEFMMTNRCYLVFPISALWLQYGHSGFLSRMDSKRLYFSNVGKGNLGKINFNFIPCWYLFLNRVNLL